MPILKLLRFYYFTFLYHYRNKPESWVGDFRSVLLVELSIFWFILTLWLLFDPGFWLIGSLTKLLVFTINVLILIILHWYLMSKGRSEVIFQEFKNHPLNNQTNRTICWAVWAGSFVLFLLSASLQ
ncbi:hypothetical protein [Pedobacter foliorum]|uniref:hypothetical protein n=1 Tax=Pedobacter foliorum TaxID=2739058 RepID=UPI0015643579|nr:hypothetical protein [Pedobacter foliorum]NRF37572.1 hypothetical protein [Pedobacter foliorum]